MKLAWGNKVSEDFARAVIAMCARVWPSDPDAASKIMACMAWESGETFSPSVKNAAGSGATGLIQFMPATARGLGTTTDALAKLTNIQQLSYVEKYFAPYARRLHTLSDFYMAILMPKYIGMPEDSVVFEGGLAFKQNAGLDTNSDAKVTKAEAAGKVDAKLTKGLSPGFAKEF